MKKSYLLTPGPTPIPDIVRAAATKEILHHRTPQFIELFHEVQNGLKKIFQTKNDIILTSSSGTGAMEAAVVNLFSPGDLVITVNAGKFGGRWTKIAQSYGLNPIEIKLAPGAPLELAILEKTLKENQNCKAVLFQASETSTGSLLPTHEICKLTQTLPSCLSVCDAITALGVFDLPMDAWGIDVLFTGAQKALMVPPGLAAISLSERAWAAVEKSKLPKFYFDLKRERKGLSKGQTAWTPSTGLIVGLRESLKLLETEGLKNTFARYKLLGEATRNAVQTLGLELVSKDAPSDAVTAVWVPKQIADGKQIPKIMRDQYGVTIAGGQDELEGKIFRLTHIGYVDKFDIVIGISALEMTLHDLGFNSFQLGSGVGAVLKTFQKNK